MSKNGAVGPPQPQPAAKARAEGAGAGPTHTLELNGRAPAAPGVVRMLEWRRGNTMIRRWFFELRYLLGRVPWDTGITPPEVVAFLDRTPPGRALDLGCGTGTNALEMARRGWEVTAVDFSSRAVVAARRRAAAARVSIAVIQGDVSDLHGVHGPFDFVLDIGCFHALTKEGQARYADHVIRRTLPGATFMLYTFIEGGGNGGRELPTEDSLLRLLTPAFALISIDHGADGRHASAWFTFLRRG